METLCISGIDIEVNQQARIGEAISSYYNLINNFKPAKNEYLMWIESLREPMKTECERKGYKYCTEHMNFVRFYLELHDYGMNDYMRENLSEEDYIYWKYGE